MKKYDVNEKQICLICNQEFDNNKDGSFSRHVKKEHDIHIRQYIKEYIYSPDDLKCHKKDCNNLVNINDKNKPKKYCEACISQKNFIRRDKKRICPVCDSPFENEDLRVKTCSFECGRKVTSQKVTKWHSEMDEVEKKERFKKIITKTARTRRKNGTPSWNSGKTGVYSEETIEKIRNATLRQLENQAFGKTSIERKMEEILDELKINYQYSKIMWKRQYDFYLIDYKVLIECDGDYWHGNPKFFPKLNRIQMKNQIKDGLKNLLAMKNGFKLIRFWEDEINNQEDMIKERITSYVGLITTT